MSRKHGSKDRSPRHAKGSGSQKPKRFHDEVKARHATYPPAGNVHMNSGMPVPDAMQSSDGMPQGEEMVSNEGGGVY